MNMNIVRREDLLGREKMRNTRPPGSEIVLISPGSLMEQAYGDSGGGKDT